MDTLNTTPVMDFRSPCPNRPISTNKPFILPSPPIEFCQLVLPAGPLPRSSHPDPCRILDGIRCCESYRDGLLQFSTDLQINPPCHQLFDFSGAYSSPSLTGSHLSLHLPSHDIPN